MSPKGEKLKPFETKHTFGNSTLPSHRKEINTMPSPHRRGANGYAD
jgi:hypothetical protein